MKPYAVLTGALMARQGEASPSRVATPILELDLSPPFPQESPPNRERGSPAWGTGGGGGGVAQMPTPQPAPAKTARRDPKVTSAADPTRAVSPPLESSPGPAAEAA